MGLGSSNLERVVIPYTNSPSTNPVTKIAIISVIAIKSSLCRVDVDSAIFPSDEKGKIRGAIWKLEPESAGHQETLRRFLRLRRILVMRMVISISILMMRNGALSFHSG